MSDRMSYFTKNELSAIHHALRVSVNWPETNGDFVTPLADEFWAEIVDRVEDNNCRTCGARVGQPCDAALHS